MKNFFKNVFATVVGIIFSCIIMSILCLFILGGIIAGISEKPTKVKENSILRISLNQDIPDKVISEFNNFDFGEMKMNKILGLNEILKTIERAKTDANIKGIYLDLSSVGSGISTVEEIRNKLLAFS